MDTRDQEKGHSEHMGFFFFSFLLSQLLSIACRFCRKMPGWCCSRVSGQGVRRDWSPDWVLLPAVWHQSVPHFYKGPIWAPVTLSERHLVVV